MDSALTYQEAGPFPNQSRFPRQVAAALGSTAFYVFVFDVLLVILFSVVSSHHRFASAANLESTLRYTTEALLLALGLTLTMSAGVFDLSLGTNLVLSSVFGAMTLRALGAVNPNGAPYSGKYMQVLLCLAVCLVSGAIFGLINGLIISVFDVNSLIATLGTLGIGTGVADVLTNGSDIAGLPSVMQKDFGDKALARIPLPFLVAVCMAVVVWLVLRHTRFGLRTLAIGSNARGAERAGIRIGPHLVRLVAIGGIFAGLAGFVDLSTFGSTAVNGHTLDGLNAATAVVIGGTALLGGRSSVAGSICGALLASIVLSGLVVAGVTSFYQQITTGFILIVAVASDRYRAKRRRT